MAIQRPGRGTTRVGHAAVPAKGAPQKPTTRTGTGQVPKQSAPPPAPPAKGRASGSSTRSVAKQSSSRPVPKAAPKSNTTMMIAIGAGVVVVLGIAAFAMSGDSKKPEPAAPKAASKAKAPVDVRGLETEGMKKCDEGLKLITKHSDLMAAATLTDSQKSTLKGDLEQGRKLISDGMSLLTQANEKSGNQYNTNQYQEALIIARRKLMMIRD